MVTVCTTMEQGSLFFEGKTVTVVYSWIQLDLGRVSCLLGNYAVGNSGSVQPGDRKVKQDVEGHHGSLEPQDG